MNAPLSDRQRRRRVVAETLRLDPAVSNRQIAVFAGVHHETVAAVRAELEASGEIRQLEATVGRDGRRRRHREVSPQGPDTMPPSASVFCHSSERMSELPDACVTLTVTSPPYNVGIPYGGDAENDQRPFGAYMAMLRGVFAEVFRVSVDGGRCCINVANTGHNPYIPLSSHINLMMEKLGWWMRGQIVWVKSDKPNHRALGSFASPSNPVLRDQHEELLIFSKGSAKLGSFERTMESQEFMLATHSIWRINPEPRRSGHPAPFPIELPRRLIRLLSFPDNLVLDPFAGSGTTLAAAESEGRRSVGYELVPEYAAAARRRLADRCTRS